MRDLGYLLKELNVFSKDGHETAPPIPHTEPMT